MPGGGSNSSKKNNHCKDDRMDGRTKVFDRKESLHRLQTETFDLCIIGGGASGAGCALDAALRGLKVALVEKTDFGAETSSKSTKLIHGGVRYLEQAFKKLDFGQLRQVRHGLEERRHLLANAPHLARPLALLTPVFSWWEGLYFRIGLWLYGRFAADKDALPASRWLGKKETLRLLPGLTGRLHSAVLYYDGQLDDARYCLALIQSAAEAGAAVVNHAEITGFEKSADGQLHAAFLQDRLQPDSTEAPRQSAFKIKARVFLNCTGPFADQVRAMTNPDLPVRMRPSKGVHLLLPLTVTGSPETALLIPKTRDGRVVFALPFQGELLLGTTDQEYPDPTREPVLEAPEVDFLLETLQPYISQPLPKNLVKAGFGGLRPLIATSKKHTKGLLRDHEVEYDPASGLFSLLGGKWTTYRLMARDAVDAVCRLLNINTPSATANYLLAGAENYATGHWQQLVRHYRLPEDVAQHLDRNYGSRANLVAALAMKKPELAQRLAPEYPFIRAEVIYAVREEMAHTPRDVLARRIRLEILNWEATKEAIPTVVALMAPELGWDEKEQALRIATYTREIASFQQALQ